MRIEIDVDEGETVSWDSGTPDIFTLSQQDEFMALPAEKLYEAIAKMKMAIERLR